MFKLILTVYWPTESSHIFVPPGGAIPEFISLQSQAETKKFPLVLLKI